MVRIGALSPNLFDTFGWERIPCDCHHRVTVWDPNGSITLAVHMKKLIESSLADNKSTAKRERSLTPKPHRNRNVNIYRRVIDKPWTTFEIIPSKSSFSGCSWVCVCVFLSHSSNLTHDSVAMRMFRKLTLGLVCVFFAVDRIESITNEEEAAAAAKNKQTNQMMIEKRSRKASKR